MYYNDSSIYEYMKKLGIIYLKTDNRFKEVNKKYLIFSIKYIESQNTFQSDFLAVDDYIEIKYKIFRMGNKVSF